jgi:hypothetical protein
MGDRLQKDRVIDAIELYCYWDEGDELPAEMAVPRASMALLSLTMLSVIGGVGWAMGRLLRAW